MPNICIGEWVCMYGGGNGGGEMTLSIISQVLE